VPLRLSADALSGGRFVRSLLTRSSVPWSPERARMRGGAMFLILCEPRADLTEKLVMTGPG